MPMHPSNKFWWFVAFSIGVTLLVFVGVTALFWHALSPAEKAFLLDIVKRHPTYPFSLFILLLVAIGFLLDGFLNNYIIPVNKIADEVTLIHRVNRSHRIRIEAGADVARLVRAVNEAADRFEAYDQEVRDKYRVLKDALDAEKDFLSGVIAELPKALLVCDDDGRVLLYNRRAMQLLSVPLDAPGGAVSPGCYVGLGRSVFDLFEKEDILQAIEKSGRTAPGDPSCQMADFLQAGPHDRLLRLEVMPIFNRRRQWHGFVLTVDENQPVAAQPANGYGPAPPATADPYFDFDLFRRSGRLPVLEQQPLSDIACTAFDTETTGLDPRGGDAIVAIGAVRIVNGRLLREEIFDRLVNPLRPVPAAATRIHGIDDAMLKDRPVIDQVLPQFHRFAADSVLVAHNASFDMRMLQLQEARTGLSFNQPVLDTLMLAAVVHPWHRNHSLEAVAARIGVPVAGRHTALGDALIAAELFLKLIPLLAEMNIVTLKDALVASQNTLWARMKY
ncbi:3'-5' exonuclease [Desulfatitalea alkaliphila]|uniref:HAMP domain-containing protein n=1 Tax=Desulfatitalea alkaliphila TaxID=2929485 RepID=A0AA41R6Z9_9BACT|nr:exonuclease domain-containing protein [Desulfatitalea alkaliphila]MCJ8500198.1 hypothetical protein [Desulfatitalea alkaliphila]